MDVLFDRHLSTDPAPGLSPKCVPSESWIPRRRSPKNPAGPVVRARDIRPDKAKLFLGNNLSYTSSLGHGKEYTADPPNGKAESGQKTSSRARFGWATPVTGGGQVGRVETAGPLTKVNEYPGQDDQEEDGIFERVGAGGLVGQGGRTG